MHSRVLKRGAKLVHSLGGVSISCIFNLKGFQKSINHESLSHYFQYGYVNQPNTIQRDIYQLSPGEILRITSNDKGFFNKENLTKYIWWESQKTFEEILEYIKNSKFLNSRPEIQKYIYTIVHVVYLQSYTIV